MSTDKEFNKLLEKIHIKLEQIGSFDEADLIEIKNKIREITSNISSTNAAENFSVLAEKLSSIEQNNNNIKITITSLIDSTKNMMDKLSTTDESSIIKLQTFLTELSYQVSSIKDYMESNKLEANSSIIVGFDDLKNSLTEFQQDLGEKIKKDFESVNFSFSSIVEELTSKLTELELHFDNYNNTLIKEVVESITEMKANTDGITQHLENITNLQNLTLTRAEFEEYQKQSEELSDKAHTEIVEEINKVIETTKKLDEIESTQEENLTKIKEELETLHNNLTVELAKIFSQISAKEDFQILKALLAKNSDTTNSFLAKIQKSSIEQASTIIKELKGNIQKIDNLNLVSSINKIDVIYDNISVINDWVSQVDKINESVNSMNEKLSIDFDELSDKVDIVYENVSILNDWAQKLDNINKTIAIIDAKVEEYGKTTEEEEDLANKVDIIYENISLLNNWISKIDNISDRVDNVSNKVDEVTDNVSNINTWGHKIEEIKERLETLSNEFAIITTATKDDTEEYIYTLLDIESDFAKLHCAIEEKEQEKKEYLKNLHEVIVETTRNTGDDFEILKSQFDVLNDDISSISKRTNKLILTSDDVNKTFKGHLNEFETLIEDLHKKILAFNPLKQFTLLENKTNTIKKLVASNLAASQNLNEAFVYLAEWIDITGNVISEIKEGIDNVQVQNANLAENSSKVDIIELKVQVGDMIEKIEHLSQNKNDVLEAVIKSLQDKFSAQEAKISNLEEQVKSLENKMEEKFAQIIEAIENSQKQEEADESSEIKPVLDFIASQVISANENSINNKVLNQKMEVMEHQLSKFEKNIAKIVSYLDED